MNTQNENNKQITAQLVKSNVSEYLVWEISVTNSRRKKHYCKTARKALGYIFILKKDSGLPIEQDTLRHLKAILAKQRAAAGTAEVVNMEAQ